MHGMAATNIWKILDEDILLSYLLSVTWQLRATQQCFEGCHWGQVLTALPAKACTTI